MRILKVIIADDMEVIAKTYFNIVAAHQNYKVVGIANNGQEEYDLIMERKPDLVITDNQMPNMNGIDVIEKIYNSDLAFKPKFVLITGDNGREIMDKCNEFDVFKMINKPVRDDVLNYTLDEVCDSIKAEKPEYLNENKRFDYEKWKEKYYNQEIVDLKKHLSESDFENLKKLGIEILDKIYTEHEFELLNMDVLEYYKDEDDVAEPIIEIKSLEGTGVSQEQYNELLNHIEEINSIYNF